MSNHHFGISEAQFARLQRLVPNKPLGIPNVDDRLVICGIIHVIRNGLMWENAPSVYGPPKTLQNRFVRWLRAGVVDRIVEELAVESTATDTVMIVADLQKGTASSWTGCSHATRTGAAFPCAMTAAPTPS